MFIVFSNSNLKKETFSLQNWLDPAKEIKKQIRSKFVIVAPFYMSPHGDKAYFTSIFCILSQVFSEGIIYIL